MGLLGKIWVKLGLDNSEFKRELQDTSKESNVFASGFKKIGGMIAGAFAVESIIRFGKEIVELRSKAKAVEGAFNALNKPTLLSELRAATNGTVSDLELMQKAVKANNFRIPMEELATYFKFASMKAMETGQSVEYLTESIVTGLARESIMILDNLTLSQVEIRKEMENGASMAKAVSNIIEREFKKSNLVLDDAISKSAKLSASWDNFKKTVAQGFIGQAASGLGTMIQNQMDAFSWLFGGKKKAKQELFSQQDEERAKKMMSYIKDINHASFELNKMEGKVLGTWEERYQQMLKEYIQREKGAALQKKSSEETIDGINKQIESLGILANAELDQKKRRYYVDEMARLTKKLSIMQMTTEELEEQRKAQALENAALIEGTIPYQEKIIKLKQEDIALTTDKNKRAALNQELANAEHKLAVMKLTTAELRDYQALIERGKTKLPSVDNRGIRGKAVVQNQKDPITGVMKSSQQTIDGLKEFNDNFEDEVVRSTDIANAFGQAVAQSIADSMKIIFDSMMKGEKIDASSLVDALISPFADMAVQIGKLMIATGAAAEAAKLLGTTGGGAGAIAVGTLLVALGSAAQAAIGTIGSSFGSANAGGSYGVNPSNGGGMGSWIPSSNNFNINVSGILKGQDIYLAVEKTKANKNR